MSNTEISQRIHPMFEQPDGWLDKSLIKFNEYSRTDGNGISTQEKLLEAQETRWTEDVGLAPSETWATVIMPIHNEAICLPSALGALAMSNIPSSTHIQFAFIVNGCTDNGVSRQIVEDFLADLGSLESEGKTDSVESLGTNSQTVRVNNLEFRLLESSEPSKTNALNIGNALAVEHGSTITINVDANNWLEPDALRSIIGKATRAVAEDEAVVLGSNSMIAFKPSILADIFARLQKTGGKVGKGTSDALHGWLMAWDTNWFDEAGGFPDIACDDYTLSLLSRKDGKEILFDNDASVWGFHPNNIGDKLETYTRLALCKLQIKDVFRNDPDIIQMLENDNAYMRPFQKRVRDLIEHIRVNPGRIPLEFAKFLVWEYARIIAELRYQSSSHNSKSWEPVSSTK